MKISYKRLILLLYSIGMLGVLLRGVLVYEFGNEHLITTIGRFISSVEIFLIILLILIQKNINISRKPKDIIRFIRALILFWFIKISLDLVNTNTSSMTLIYFITIIILLLLINYNYDFFNKLIKITLFTFVIICILSLIFMNFGYGIQVNGQYQVVSAIGIRLYGMTQHANSLGAIAGLVCIYSYYKKNKLYFFIGLVTLWYTQSKTNIIILLVCLIIEWFRVIINKFNKKDKKYLYTFLIGIIIFIFIISVSLGVISNIEFTGRTSTWRYYLNGWKTNLKTVFIGCNAELLYLNKYAENMYIDMISKYGIVGLSSFIYLLLIMFKISWENMKSGYLLSFYLFIFIALRSITESIFISASMGFGDFFNFVFLIIINETYLRHNIIKENREMRELS